MAQSQQSSQLASRIAFVSVADMSEDFLLPTLGSLCGHMYSSQRPQLAIYPYMLAVVVSSRFITIMLLCNMMRGLRCLSLCTSFMTWPTRSLPAAEQRSLGFGHGGDACAGPKFCSS